MDWDMWPQWVVVVALSLPLISWPAFRVANKTPFDAEWIERYLARWVQSGMGGFVLYMGGFWS